MDGLASGAEKMTYLLGQSAETIQQIFCGFSQLLAWERRCRVYLYLEWEKKIVFKLKCKPEISTENKQVN